MKKEFKSLCYVLGAVGQMPQLLKARVTEEQQSEHTLSWALPAVALPVWEAAWENSQFAFWDRFFKSFHDCCSFGGLW